mmetsp:Transcript_2768/g.4129  ORF Transcript_2768/g.4129 Transcript_2768/m.4129 type:complete len:112 (+) Transcript_2768:2196-2531(+)
MTLNTMKELAEGASLPEPLPAQRKLRGADMVQKCWWLLIPIIIVAITLAFLPSEMLPKNMVSFSIRFLDQFDSFCPVCYFRLRACTSLKISTPPRTGRIDKNYVMCVNNNR